MPGTTRRELIKMSGVTLAALSAGGTALHASQLPGQPSGEASAARPPAPFSVMSIAAAPGDVFFAMGAPVALATQQGGTGFLLSLTLGERGSSTIPPAQYGVMQRDASDKAAAMLGATPLFLAYPDGEVPDNEEAALAVCDILRRYKPATVVTHWKGSWHKDHRACFNIVQNAIFYAGLVALTRERPAHEVRQLFFADNWEDAKGFIADTYLDVSPVFDRYLNACSLFPMWRGETGFRYNDYYSSRAVDCGCLSHCRYAVSLMSPAEQLVRNLQAL
jgi:N-acetylglucosamine malate deacetylase 1